MSRKNLEANAGFGVVGIVLTVVAVLVVGLIAWRVYDANNKPQESVSTEARNQARDQPAQVQADPNAGYVVIEQWGVRFKPAESLGEVQYFKPKDLEQYDAFTFTTKTLADDAESCSSASENIILGLLYRNKEQQPQYGSLIAKIGDYYYQYRGPQSTCGSSDMNAESAALTQLSQSLNSLEAAK